MQTDSIQLIPLKDAAVASVTCEKGVGREDAKADAQRLKKACQDFESIFIAHLLRTARGTAEEGGIFGDGLGGEFYQEIMEEEVAKKVAYAGGLGLADVLYRSFIINNPRIESNGIAGKGEPLTVEQIYERVHGFHAIIEGAADSCGLNRELIYAVISQESGGNRAAVSPKGARGLMQIMEGTARDLGVHDAHDPEENIRAGARYLRGLLDRFNGDLRLALAAYNAGPGAVEKYGGIPPFRETEHYVAHVLFLSQRFRTLLTDSVSE